MICRNATATLLLLTLNFIPSVARADGVWRHDFAQAEADAKKNNQLLLVHFHASWCGPCRRMDAEVLSSSELQGVVSGKMVAVKVDFDQHPDLGQRFSVNALPHDLVINPQGQVIGRMEGYQAKAKYTASLSGYERQFAATQKPKAAPAVATTKPAPKAETTPKTAATQPGTIQASASRPQPVTLDHPEASVAMDSFCPVTLFKTRQWKKGNSKFAWEYQGVTFLLSGQNELNEFKADPARFAPQLLGCDPVVLWDSERALPGHTRFGAYFNGELFLFETAENRARFRENPPRYTQTRHVLRVEDVERKRTL